MKQNIFNDSERQKSGNNKSTAVIWNMGRVIFLENTADIINIQILFCFIEL